MPRPRLLRDSHQILKRKWDRHGWDLGSNFNLGKMRQWCDSDEKEREVVVWLCQLARGRDRIWKSDRILLDGTDFLLHGRIFCCTMYICPVCNVHSYASDGSKKKLSTNNIKNRNKCKHTSHRQPSDKPRQKKFALKTMHKYKLNNREHNK
jgi:hypothetical protein